MNPETIHNQEVSSCQPQRIFLQFKQDFLLSAGRDANLFVESGEICSKGGFIHFSPFCGISSLKLYLESSLL